MWLEQRRHEQPPRTIFLPFQSRICNIKRHMSYFRQSMCNIIQYSYKTRNLSFHSSSFQRTLARWNINLHTCIPFCIKAILILRMFWSYLKIIQGFSLVIAISDYNITCYKIMKTFSCKMHHYFLAIENNYLLYLLQWFLVVHVYILQEKISQKIFSVRLWCHNLMTERSFKYNACSLRFWRKISERCK